MMKVIIVQEKTRTGEVKIIKEAGNRYAVRYEELAMFLVSTL